MILPLNDIYLFLLILFRTSAAIAFLPIWGERGIPGPVKVALIVGLTLGIMPLMPAENVIPEELSAWIIVLFKETLVGLIIGFCVRVIFGIAEFTGQIISTEIGLSRGEIFNPTLGSSNSTISMMLFYLMGLLFFMLGVHHEILISIFKSYSIVPFGTEFKNLCNVEQLIYNSAQLFAVSFKIAAPIITINFVVTLGFAVLGKSAPKLNVFFLSFPVRILVGLTFLTGMLTLIYRYFYRLTVGMPEAVIKTLIN